MTTKPTMTAKARRTAKNNSEALAREARAQRSTMGNKIWLTIHQRKFGYDVEYARPPARPPTRTHTSFKCHNRSYTTWLAFQLCKPSVWVRLDWQPSKSDIRWQLSHDRLAGSGERPVVLRLHISWYNMPHLPIQHKNETTPGKAVSWLTVV